MGPLQSAGGFLGWGAATPYPHGTVKLRVFLVQLALSLPGTISARQRTWTGHIEAPFVCN